MTATGTPYHPGERAVQARTGRTDRADHSGRAVGSTVPAVAARFLTERRMLVVGAADADGLPGPPSSADRPASCGPPTSGR